MSIQNPVYVRDLFGGKVTLIVFGAPFNWNYAGASREEMEAKNPGITAVLEEVMHMYDIKRALVPKPAFNARVVTSKDLPNELLPNFFRGADADGVVLEKPGDAYFLASADCLATVLFDEARQTVVPTHCGRDAMIDRGFLNTGNRREHVSVIDAAIALLEESMDRSVPSALFVPMDLKLHAFLAAGIRPETFDHPIHDEKYGEANKRMIYHLIDEQAKQISLPSIVKDASAGKIDLFALVRHQLVAHGVADITEDYFDTATSMHAGGHYLFHSNRRDKTLRNLVVVKLN